MLLTDYVPAYEEIRALLGVSDEELADGTLGLRVFLRSLEEGLNEIDDSLTKPAGSLLAQFKTVAKIANETRTATQQRFFEAVQTYATYHVAADLTVTLPQFSPKTISDGKAMVQRHADSPYKVTIDGVLAGKSRALSRLKNAYQIQLGETPTSVITSLPAVLVISAPDTDTVTGS